VKWKTEGVPQNKLHVLECAAKGKSLRHEKNSLEWKARERSPVRMKKKKL